MDDKELKQLLEAAILVADRPLSTARMRQTILADVGVSPVRLNELLIALADDYRDRGIELVKVGSGYRFQSRASLSPRLSSLWQEKAPRYSRALLETLALVAYRQPITRGEIEAIRGVAVSSQIMRTLQERNWLKVVGHKEVPGRPALYATTAEFLDYFCIGSLSELPAIADADSVVLELADAVEHH